MFFTTSVRFSTKTFAYLAYKAYKAFNAQVPRFNSKFAFPCCSGVDALAQDWRDEIKWVCPPVSAIVPSVRALSPCSGHDTLIVPQWPSAYFWPFLHESSSQFKSFVKRVFELPCIENLLLGRSWLEANLQGASLGFQWFPEIQNVSLAGRFSVSFCHPCLPCTSLFFQLYSSPCHC